MARWEDVTSDNGGRVRRMQVPGGWLVAVSDFEEGTGVALAMTFLPDAGHTWTLDESGNSEPTGGRADGSEDR